MTRPLLLLRMIMPSRVISGRVRSLGLISLTVYLGYGLSFLSAPVLARTLGAVGRGEIASILVPYQFLSWLVFLGVPYGLATKLGKQGAIRPGSLLQLLGLGIVGYGVIWLSAPVFAHGQDFLITYMRVGGLPLIFSGVANLGWDLALARGWILRWLAVRSTFLIMPSIAILILAASRSLTVFTAYYSQIAFLVVGVILGIFLVVSEVASGGLEIPWRFSLGLWFASSLDSLGGRLDQFILAAFQSTETLGVYAVAVTCASASTALSSAFSSLSLNEFIAAIDDGNASQRTLLRSRLRQSAMWSLFSSAAVVVGIVFLAMPLFGRDFSALPVLTAVLCVAQLFDGQSSILATFDSARGVSRTQGTSSLIALCVLAVVAVLLQLSGALSSTTMAIAILVFSAVRWGSRTWLVGRGGRARVGEAVGDSQ